MSRSQSNFCNRNCLRIQQKLSVLAVQAAMHRLCQVHIDAHVSDETGVLKAVSGLTLLLLTLRMSPETLSHVNKQLRCTGLLPRTSRCHTLDVSGTFFAHTCRQTFKTNSTWTPLLTQNVLRCNTKDLLSGIEQQSTCSSVPDIACKPNYACRQGRYNLDPNVKFFAVPPVHGSLARFVDHPADFCFRLPPSLTYEQGAMVEPLSCGGLASP